MLGPTLDRGLTPWASRRPLHPLLGVFEIVAAVCLVPFALMSPGPGGDLSDGLTALGWLLLAAVNLVPRLRPARVTFEISLFAAAALVAVQVGVSARAQSPMLGGLLLAALSLFGVFSLSVRQLYRWLALSGAAFIIGAGIASPMDGVAALIGVVLVALMALTVRRLVQQVVHAAEHDPLTGALNRLGLHDRADLVRAYAHRRGEPTTVAVLDIDHFKSYNDRLGHAAGDKLLIDVVTRLQAALRRSDLIARFGGDEFVLVLVGADDTRARTVLTRVLPDLPVRCSYGIADWAPDTDLAVAMDAADRAMYTHRRQLRART